MKSLLSLCFCFVLSVQIMAQRTYQTTFPFDYKTASVDCLIPASNGGSIVLGYQPTYCVTNQSCKAYITAHCFDDGGALVWSKNYATGISFSKPKAIALQRGGFAFFGRLFDSSDRKYKGGLLVKCDTEGNVIWSKQFRSKNFPAVTPQLMTEDNEGNLLLLYSVDYSGISTNELEIIKINVRGDVVWTTATYLSSSGNSVSISSFAQHKGIYFFSVNSDCGECQETTVETSLLTMRSDGTFVNSKNLVTGNQDFFYNITTTQHLFINNGSLYLLGYNADGEESNNFILPVTSDTATSATAAYFAAGLFSVQLYARKHNNILPFYYGGVTYFGKDGSITQTGAGYKSGYLFHYDSRGRICPDLSLPQVDTSSYKKLISFDPSLLQAEKDEIYLTDREIIFSENPLSDTLVCSSGFTTEENTGKITASAKSFASGKISVYPNPARNIINVTGLIQDNVDVKILSSSGIVIQSVKLSLINHAITIADLRNGIYFIKIEESGRRSSIIPFVKE